MGDPNGARPRLSVVVPTYNRSELLRRTLRTLAAQRFPAASAREAQRRNWCPPLGWDEDVRHEVACCEWARGLEDRR